MRVVPMLVMIHGLMGSLDNFDAGERIGEARVAMPDLLGYGSQAGVQTRGLTLAGQAEHVVGLIRALPDETVWLLGHSMGGAVAMLVADRIPDRIASVINVEGNFTLKDAFWSARIAEQGFEDWTRDYRRMQCDCAGWLQECGIKPSDERIRCAEAVFANQPAETVYAMSHAIVRETAAPAYLDCVRRVVERGCPVHLVAGERSAADWDVPDFVRRAARSYTEQPGAGHLMMLEDPDAFCQIVNEIMRRA
ncbi:MAG: alpha/beta hydrolase [Planctomycetes bacterium]|nr:alpha/beta hydrolase [Planctomycetota bacterium]